MGCDHARLLFRNRLARFQSTHPRGVRLAWTRGASPTRSRFNPRTRVGCDVAHFCGSSVSAGFNPRTRVGCDSSSKTRPQMRLRFNPRTRVGCDVTKGKGSERHGVSIHAPAWGATKRTAFCGWFHLVSIHAPAWGATAYAITCHASQGSVSIHAPAWGATHKFPLQNVSRGRFNPRTRVGCDFIQSCGRIVVYGFNPRTRVGCDGSRSFPPTMILKFQSTHPRGVRQGIRSSGRIVALVSIHAPAWGATRRRSLPAPPSNVSIHAPAWGATMSCGRQVRWQVLFQSTHPRGVRLSLLS